MESKEDLNSHFINGNTDSICFSTGSQTSDGGNNALSIIVIIIVVTDSDSSDDNQR